MGYGASKMMMEKCALNFFTEYGLDITILRACWFYGPHQPLRQTKFFRLVREGKFPFVGNGENKRSLSYVDDLCRAMVLAVANPISQGKIYWIADKAPYSMNTIIDTVAASLKEDFGIKVAFSRVKLPGFVGSLAYFTDLTLQKLGFYNKEIHVLSEMNKNIACSIERAERELAFIPSRTLREGMRTSIEWCLKNGYEIS